MFLINMLKDCQCEQIKHSHRSLKEIPSLLCPVKTSLFAARPEQPTCLRWRRSEVRVSGRKPVAEEGYLSPSLDVRWWPKYSSCESGMRTIAQRKNSVWLVIEGCTLQGNSQVLLMSLKSWCLYNASGVSEVVGGSALLTLTFRNW